MPCCPTLWFGGFFYSLWLACLFVCLSIYSDRISFLNDCSAPGFSVLGLQTYLVLTYLFVCLIFGGECGSPVLVLFLFVFIDGFYIAWVGLSFLVWGRIMLK